MALQQEDVDLIRMIIREELAATGLDKSDRYTFQKRLQILDGRHIQLGEGTGTKIGTGVTEKLGFFGVTPVRQTQSPPSKPTGGSDSDGTLRTQFGVLVDALTSYGLLP